jgi:hypothetical protein
MDTQQQKELPLPVKATLVCINNAIDGTKIKVGGEAGRSIQENISQCTRIPEPYPRRRFESSFLPPRNTVRQRISCQRLMDDLPTTNTHTIPYLEPAH